MTAVALAALGATAGRAQPALMATHEPSTPITSDTELAALPSNHVLRDAIAKYAARRHGAVSVAVFDRTARTVTIYSHRKRFDTASIVKVDILQTRLHQTTGRLSATQKSLAHRMIEDSDNDAASALWNDDGGGAGLAKYDAALGLSQTVPGHGAYWGLTTTSALDQVMIVRELLRQSSLIGPRSRSYERSLMRHVTSSQRWGITAGPTHGTTVGVKNGWLPVASDHYRWTVNSIGWVHGDDRHYIIAVLTAHESSMNYGIDTIEHISRQVWLHTRHTPTS